MTIVRLIDTQIDSLIDLKFDYDENHECVSISMAEYLKDQYNCVYYYDLGRYLTIRGEEEDVTLLLLNL